jgi:serine/threonine protein kinase
MTKVFTIAEGLENLGALSTGGQGSVYKAKRGEVITAVKILPTPIHSEDENDKNYKDFQNEVSKLQKVNSEANPNVVKILSSGITESGSLPYIEMEFIEGPDVADLLKPPLDTVFTIQEAVKVAEQLSNALAHCHKVSVKHGDIKSNNVKYNIQTGNYMLLDFGLAIMSDEQRRTSLRNAGAIEFMAPEQHDGEMLVQSDVYSFGIVLYEVLAGSVPFPLLRKGESSRNAVMVAQMEKPAPDILQLRDQNIPQSWEESRKDFEMLVPAWLLEVIAKCLEKRPENRFKDGLELHHSIVEASRLYAETYAYDTTDSAALRRENERLRELLLEHQKSSDALPVAAIGAAAAVPVASEITDPTRDSLFDRPSVKKSPGFLSKMALGNIKPVLVGLGILLACLVLFAGYSSMNSPKEGVIDSAAFIAEKQRMLDSISMGEKLQAERTQDSLDNIERLGEVAGSNRSGYNDRDDRRSDKESEKEREREKKKEEKYRERERKDAKKLRKN